MTIINSISDGVLAVDMNMKIIFFNKSAETITGTKREDAIGKPCSTILRSDHCETNCLIRRTITTGTPVINHFVCISTPLKKRLPVSVSTAVLLDSRNRIVGGVETFRDLSQVETLRKQLEQKYTFEDMIGYSPQMQEMFRLLPLVARSDSTVLITGDSGTGKELIARAIHNGSPRREKPLVTVNCGAIPETLLESELFGFKAGAFTGAQKDKKGRFALAEGGSIFLDEIGDLPSNLQVKILRFLQEKIYEPLGSVKPLKADVRIIAATNRNLSELVNEGKFRKDLFYRLNVFNIHVPPLIERKMDIPYLVDHFIGKFNMLKQKDISGISPPALKIILNHDFPGNVRELENIIEHAFILCPGGVIKPEHLPDYLFHENRIPVVEIAKSMDEMEAIFITAALKRNNWSRKLTARELGIDVSTLYRKMKKLNITCPHKNENSD